MGSKRALIFGANGFVGGWLARELADNGWRVAGTDIADEPAHTAFDEYQPCDLLDGEAVTSALSSSGCDAVINLAAVSSVGQSWRNPRLTMEVNVIGTLNILDAVRAMQDKPRVLLVGSSEEYAPSSEPLSEDAPIDANNPYGISKATQERMALLYACEYGVPVCLTRSFNHTGPGQTPSFVLPSWCKQVAEIERSGCEGKLHVGNLHVSRDFSDVRDVVRAYRLILESDLVGEVFNVGSGVARTLDELAQTIVSFASVPIAIEVDPALVRDVDNPFICCDSAKLQNRTGWAPQYEMKETLEALYETFLTGDGVDAGERA